MTERELVTWGAIAEKFLIPLALAAISIVAGYGASEISGLRKDLQAMQIQIAELRVTMTMHLDSGK